MFVVQTTSVCLHMFTAQSLMMTIKNMFSPGCRGGLRNRQLLMNDSETANDQQASCAASGRLSGRFLSRECVCSFIRRMSSSWLTFPEGVSIVRDLAESTQASSARWANGLINDHHGPHRSPCYRRSSARALADDAARKRSYGAHSEELEAGTD